MPPRSAARLPLTAPLSPCSAENAPPFGQWLQEARTANGASMTEHEALGIQIRRYYESTRPPRSVELAREGLLERLQEIIQARWPAANLQLSLFGSSLTNIHTPSSDIDLVLLDPARAAGTEAPHSSSLPEWFDVKVLAKQLRSHAQVEGFTDVRAISAASVPIVTFKISGIPRLQGIKVDIAVNNRFGIANGELINAYANIRPALVRPLCLTVKRWLKQRGLNEPAPQEAGQQRSLCSYTIILLVIAYLQATQRLPNLQDPELLGRMWLRPRWQWGPKDATPQRTEDDDDDDSLNGTDEGSIHSDEGGLSRSSQSGTKYDISFFDPFSDLTRRCCIKKIQDPGHLAWMRSFYYRKRRIPSILHEWLHNYESIRSANDVFKGLPTPEGVALHQKASPNAREADAELGSCLTGFIDWFLGVWHRKGHNNKPCFDIASSHPRVVNTLRQLELWEAWKRFGHHSSEDEPAFDRFQGADWPRHRLVVPDPFLKQRNTARNVKDSVAHDLHGEFIRAQQILRSAGGTKLEKLFESIRAERPYVVDGGAEELSRMMQDVNLSSRGGRANSGDDEDERRSRLMQNATRPASENHLARRGSNAVPRGKGGGGASRGSNGVPVDAAPIATSAPRGRGGWSGRGGRGRRLV